MMNLTSVNNRALGRWSGRETDFQFGDMAIARAIRNVGYPVFLINVNNRLAVVQAGRAVMHDDSETTGYPVVGYAPPLGPGDLGDPVFKKRYDLKYAYVAGAMANGITSTEMVEKAGRAGMVGFFGAAGLCLDNIESAVDRIRQNKDNVRFGFNLIHSPGDSELEAGTVDLYLRKKIRLISAAAFLTVTLPLVYYRVKGIYRNNNGEIVCPNKIIAKVSRIEVAKRFFSPPPEKLLTELVQKQMITREEARLACLIPMADDLTAEADSGGHTDNRSALTLLPVMLSLRDELCEKYQYKKPICVGLGGGIATPHSTAAAFAMGAAFVLTGSVNQACVEAGTSDIVRGMLAQTRQADVTMAPSADMFEMGVKVQVMKRGTMFPVRAEKLYNLYKKYECYEEIPDDQRAVVENNFFRSDFQEQWDRTKKFFNVKDPKQIERARKDPKHKMALVFRSYLGQASKWAVSGEPSRKIDYQIWCGPSMGAFNEWVKGTFLEKPENRDIVTVAMNLLFGASLATRVNWLCSRGVSLGPAIKRFPPLPLNRLLQFI
jgi:trans-AT polyketide synthase, acyltransferase and oxidoreductase domains